MQDTASLGLLPPGEPPLTVPAIWFSFVSALTPNTSVHLMVSLSPKPSMAPQCPQFKVESFS